MCFLTFSHFEEPCVCLRDLKNLQTTVHGFDLFLWNLPMRWQRSISMSSVISNLFLIIFLTSSSQLPQVSFDVSGMSSVRTLFCRYLSSSSATSAWQKWSKRSSSISLRLAWSFLISFFTFAKPSWSSYWVNSRLLVMSTTCEILSRRSWVFVSWDLIISVTFSWWSSNSSYNFS